MYTMGVCSILPFPWPVPSFMHMHMHIVICLSLHYLLAFSHAHSTLFIHALFAHPGCYHKVAMLGAVLLEAFSTFSMASTFVHTCAHVQSFILFAGTCTYPFEFMLVWIHP